MIEQLPPNEVESLLKEQVVGRIGCYDGSSVYVVPISYAYEDGCIYCHSHEGKKIQIMRNNPGICFQVDEMRDMSNWKSVIAWGEFEELSENDERNKALHVLLKRRLPIRSSATTHLGETWPFTGHSSTSLKEIPGIVFRIKLHEKTGKCEHMSESHLGMFT